MAGPGSGVFFNNSPNSFSGASPSLLISQMLRRIKALEAFRQQAEDGGGVRSIARLPALVEDPASGTPGSPFGQSFTWIEAAPNTTSPPHGTQLVATPFGGHSEFGPDGNDNAVLATPPAGELRAMPDQHGRLQFIWSSITHVLGATITQVIGGPNATYHATSFDAAYRTPSPLTPIDRWPGIQYPARTVGSVVILLVRNANTMLMLGLEAPPLTPCPGAAPLSSSSSSIDTVMRAGF